MRISLKRVSVVVLVKYIPKRVRIHDYICVVINSHLNDWCVFAFYFGPLILRISYCINSTITYEECIHIKRVVACFLTCSKM